MTEIRCEGVGKRYARTSRERWLWSRVLGRPPDWFWALRDVTLPAIGPGRRIGIVGANGSGKTTLLRLIAGVTLPTCGALVIRGRIGSLLELEAGTQGELTGRENIILYGTILGMRRREIRWLFDAIVAFAGIEPFLEMPLKHYSLGMKMRLGFGVAVHMPVDIMLVDEAWSVGDAAFQALSIGRLQQLQGQGVTTIVVSHDAEAIRRLTDTAVWLAGGRVARCGPTEDVLAAYHAAPRAISSAG